MIIWNVERDELLKGMVLKGLPAREIAAAFGDVSRNAVLGRIFRLRIRPPRPSIPVVVVAPIEQPIPAPVLAPPPVRPKRDRKKRVRRHRHIKGIPLLELQEGQCRFVLTDDSPHLFCGQPAVAGLPYCPDHCKIAYRHEQYQPSRDYHLHRHRWARHQRVDHVVNRRTEKVGRMEPLSAGGPQ